MKIYICENCGKEHDGSYGSGRFCSCKCRSIWSGKCTAQKNHKCNFHKRPRAPYGTWKCNICNTIFETHSKLWEHKHEKHNDQLNGPHGKGQTAWNKGLTKNTSNTVKQISQNISYQYKTGKLVPGFKGKKHSDISKKKMSKSALASKHQRICKKTEPYLKMDGTIVNLDSSYERILAKILDDQKIKWIRPKPLIWVDKENIQHHYFPDFYLEDFNIYLDPKNEYCFRVQKEKIDYIKKHYLNCFFLHEHDLTKEFIMSLCQNGL